jgi:hypothetical protein
VYKILSLDGGGAWALIQVKALQDIYGTEALGHAVLSDFDMAVANSGGSIVLGGLLENQPLSTVLNDFMDEALRHSIFQPTTHILDWLISRTGFGPRYSSQRKLPPLQRLLPNSGGKPLTEVARGVRAANSEADVHILITGFDYDRSVAAFFRSKPVGSVEWGEGGASDDVELAQAIHASSNAPVNFFDGPASWSTGGARFWDGAIAACNNPVLAGVAEAITLEVAPHDIRALSIGTGTVRKPGPPSDNPAPLFLRRTVPSFLADLPKLAGSITDDPPDVASFLAHVMTDGREGLPPGAVSRIVRMNPMISLERTHRDDQWRVPGGWPVARLAHLQGVDLTALAQPDVQLISDFADLWLRDETLNQPLRVNADTLASKLGADRYSRALAAWLEITRGA